MSWQDPERFELVCIRVVDGDAEPIGYSELVGPACDELIDIVVSHYETYLDARLGAQGLAALGYRAVGIKDRETEEMLRVTPVTKDEIIPSGGT